MKKDKDNVGTAAIESALISQTILNNLQNGTSEKFVSEDDYLKLSRLVIEHTFRADNGLSNTLDELYADNGELILPGAELHGRKAIREWGQRIIENAQWRVIRHVCGNMRFVSTGPDTAEGVVVLTVFMVAGQDTATTLPLTVGEDHDRYIRTEEGWKFVSRKWVELFSRGDVLNVH
jgi:hypothetical protein